MKYTSLLIALLFSSGNVLLAQPQKPVHDQYIQQVELGVRKLGTGDMSGHTLNTEFKRFLKGKMFYTIGLGATLHSGSFDLTYLDNGILRKAPYRYGTDGLQASAKLGWAFVRS